MGKGSLSAQLQAELDKLIAPLQRQQQHYAAARTYIKKKIAAYFFTPENQTIIHEVMKCVHGEEHFVPLDVNILNLENKNLPEFSQSILDCGLGLQKEGEFFLFLDVPTLPQNSKDLMKQFACALSIYCICYGLESIYDAILQHPHLQTSAYSAFLPEIEKCNTEYQQGLKNTDDLSAHLQATYFFVLNLQKRMRAQHLLINQNLVSFNELIALGSSAVDTGLKVTSAKLIEAKREFADNTWLGSAWSSLVMDMLYQLLAGHYSYSWKITSTILVNESYITSLSTELAQFSQAIEEKMALFKLALLKESGDKVHQIIEEIQALAGVKQISLEEEPRPSRLSYLRLSGFFVPPNNSSTSPNGDFLWGSSPL